VELGKLLDFPIQVRGLAGAAATARVAIAELDPGAAPHTPSARGQAGAVRRFAGRASGHGPTRTGRV
jgi:hypothetical protein